MELTKTDQMILEALKKHMSEEPPCPDPEEHTIHEMATVARRYEEWDVQRSAYRALLGARLVNRALEA